MKKIYISGPISGHDDKNEPAFRAGADRWLDIMFPVVPHDIPLLPGFEVDGWHHHMRADIAGMMSCDAIYMLRGWRNSRGARLELHIALELGLEPFFEAMD